MLSRARLVFIAVFISLLFVSFGGQSPASAEKLIWGEGDTTGYLGYEQDISFNHGNLVYADPAASPVARKTLITEVDFLDSENLAIPSATFDASMNMSNLKTSYIFYMKNGALYFADTTTLASKKISNESALKYENVCQIRTLIDWKTPLESTVFYSLKGPSAACNDGDDLNKAVRLNMASTSAPVSMPGKYPMVILMDGRYVLGDFSGSPFRARVCKKDLSSCSTISTFVTDIRPMHYDASRVILRIDGNLVSYKYTLPVSKTTLYTISPGNEEIAEARVDKDGSVYFMVKDLVGDGTKYTNSIKKFASTTGAVSTLATFTTTKPLSNGDMTLASSYIVYAHPNSARNGSIVRSVNKTGTSIKTLATSSVNGGVVGSYLYFEDKDAKVNRIALNGSTTTLTSLADAQIVGATRGGRANWYYGFITSAFRGIVAVGNELKSFSYSDTFASPGVVLGDLPVNLSNPGFMGTGSQMIGKAGRRGTDYSKGLDVIYVDALKAGSFKRLTNMNGMKVAPEISPR